MRFPAPVSPFGYTVLLDRESGTGAKIIYTAYESSFYLVNSARLLIKGCIDPVNSVVSSKVGDLLIMLKDRVPGEKINSRIKSTAKGGKK